MAHVVFHWPSIGPYHIARLRACQRAAPVGVEVVGVAVAGEVEGRPWSPMDGEGDVCIKVAFPQAQYHKLQAKEMAPVFQRILDELRPVATSICGYGMSDARTALRWCRRYRAIAILMSDSKADDAPRRFWKEWLKRLYVSRFDAAVCAGTLHRRYLEQLGMQPSRIFDKYDVVDNELFAAGAAKARRQPDAFRHLPGLEDLKPFFLVSSRLIERKNLHRLLLAFARYRQLQPPGWRLVLLGTGPGEGTLKELIQEQAIPDVTFAGFQQMENLVAYYALASAFVHPAVQEQWGLVINEAMACGLPVLSSRTVGAAHDLVREGINGFTFDPSSVEDIAHAMQRAWKLEAGELKRMGAESARIISEWSPEHFARSFWSAVGAAGGLKTLGSV